MQDSAPPDPTDSKLASRLAWIERRRAQEGQALNVEAEGALGSGPENRHGLPRLPQGQTEAKKWPVLDLGHHPAIAPEDWALELGGLIENPQCLDWAGLMGMEQVEEQSDFHCVTTWSLMDSCWNGVRFADLAARANPAPEARHLLVTAYDVEPMSGVPYTTNLRLADALQPDVMLVHGWNGAPLPREHGGPVRMITPRLYAWKGAKWIRRIDFLAEEQLGFWEQRGYSNGADPWREDRFSSS